MLSGQEIGVNVKMVTASKWPRPEGHDKALGAPTPSFILWYSPPCQGIWGQLLFIRPFSAFESPSFETGSEAR